MRRNVASICLHLVLVAILCNVLVRGECSAQRCTDYDGCGRSDLRVVRCVADSCPCQHHGWDGKRQISYQQQKDLFYNYYAQPGPFYNTPAQMYVSPLPVPANVGHTYMTYQPFMPHEYMYHHNRSYYTYNSRLRLDADQCPLRHLRQPAAQGFCGRLALPDVEQHLGPAQRLLLPGPALVSGNTVSAGGHAGLPGVRRLPSPAIAFITETKMNRRFLLSLLAAAVIAVSLAESATAAPVHVAGAALALLRLEQAVRAHRLRPAGVAGRAADRDDANQLGLGRRQLAARAARPPVHAQLPRRRPVRRPVPHDADLAERHDAIRRLQRPRTVVSASSTCGSRSEADVQSLHARLRRSCGRLRACRRSRTARR